MNLPDFQLWMQQLLLNPNGQTELDAPIESLVLDTKRLSARGHLAIYQRSYIARLRDCMRKVFAALEYALGEELFEAFADMYLETHPSNSYNLTGLGEKFAEFLEATRPDAHEAVKEDWPDFMIELARFEYATNILFDEEEKSHGELATLETREENLALVSVFGLFAFRFPIRPYYSAFVQGEAPPLPALQASYCAIVRQRHNYRIALFDLQPAQFYFLQEMQQGKTVDEALEHVVSNFNANAEELQAVWKIWKEKWIEAGFFVGAN